MLIAYIASLDFGWNFFHPRLQAFFLSEMEATIFCWMNLYLVENLQRCFAFTGEKLHSFCTFVFIFVGGNGTLKFSIYEVRGFSALQ